MAFDYFNEDSSQPIGTFFEVNPNKAKYLSCFNISQVRFNVHADTSEMPHRLELVCYQVAVTHVNSNLKGNVTLKWAAPADFTGRVVFRCSFTQSFRTFWHRVPSAILEVAETVSFTCSIGIKYPQAVNLYDLLSADDYFDDHSNDYIANNQHNDDYYDDNHNDD